jgi:peptide-methionine (S)-S-oxide reductase
MRTLVLAAAGMFALAATDATAQTRQRFHYWYGLTGQLGEVMEAHCKRFNESQTRYEAVCTGVSGHAEAIRIDYDPAVIGFPALLQVFFAVAHDATQLNRQGPDTGPQYRSALFTRGPEQERIARAYVAQLDRAGTWKPKIVTTFEGAKPFYPAENYHQNYLRAHPTQPYIVWNDIPKVEGFKRLFSALWSDKPAV